MACYRPLTGYRSRFINASGKRSIVFNKSQGYSDLPVQVPCNQCIGCRLEKARQWAIRCVHEAQLHDSNCFITLTYDDEHLPEYGTLVKKHFQDFMKRLRERRAYGTVRVFYCGEYGDRRGRPHYHAILFGVDFPDKERIEDAPSGSEQYFSKELNEIWSDEKGKLIGRATIGSVTFESAAYIGRYVTKKLHGKHKQGVTKYDVVDPVTGEVVFERLPEFAHGSKGKKGGIGRPWFEKFSQDVRKDFITVRGRRMKPPKYYDTLQEKVSPDHHAKVKGKRKRAAKKHEGDNTYERLRVREQCQQASLNQLKRKLDNET